MTRWSIGDLAKASGLTVRTLHHHDEIGLVGASERTASGHRRYTPEDVRRLYQVRSLRQLGPSLEEVRAALSRSDSLRPIFQAQQVEAPRSRLTALLDGHTTESLLSTRLACRRRPGFLPRRGPRRALTLPKRQILT